MGNAKGSSASRIPFSPELLGRECIICGAMTPEEHLLVIYMLARDQQMIRTLADMLKSRGVVSEDDIPAFEFALQQDDAATSTLLQEVKRVYQDTARIMGVETGLKP